jgi:hypothetical protein
VSRSLAMHWSDFSVAVVGAFAALTGLLFVAVSINLDQILAMGTLAGRALSTMILFVVPLLVGIPCSYRTNPRRRSGSSCAERAWLPAVACSGSTGRPVVENWNRGGVGCLSVSCAA